MAEDRDVVRPVDGRVVARHAGLGSFARLPRLEDVDRTAAVHIADELLSVMAPKPHRGE